MLSTILLCNYTLDKAFTTRIPVHLPLDDVCKCGKVWKYQLFSPELVFRYSTTSPCSWISWETSYSSSHNTAGSVHIVCRFGVTVKRFPKIMFFLLKLTIVMCSFIISFLLSNWLFHRPWNVNSRNNHVYIFLWSSCKQQEPTIFNAYNYYLVFWMQFLFQTYTECTVAFSQT